MPGPRWQEVHGCAKDGRAINLAVRYRLGNPGPSDWFISSVRPTVTYYVVGLWGAIKLAIIVGAYRETGDWVATLTRPEIWTSFDQDVLLMVLAFWFSDAVLRRKRAAAR